VIGDGKVLEMRLDCSTIDGPLNGSNLLNHGGVGVSYEEDSDLGSHCDGCVDVKDLWVLL
jgi:hypothetical protein